MQSTRENVVLPLTRSLSFLCVALVASQAHAAFVTFSAGGDSTSASIQSTVDAFRAAAGNPNNANNPGPLASGRREINWDGGGAVDAATSAATFTGFTNNRGATFVTPGTGFLQTPLTDPALTSINPTYSTTFGFFSPLRILTPLGSNVTDATFSVPGTGGAVQATVSGFGVVFTDVDLLDSARVEFFDLANNSLLALSATAGTVADGSLSFLGVMANAGEQIARVRITAGTVALGPNDGGSVDVVAMDDFLYPEPEAVPEPASSVLGLIALGGLVAFAVRRK